MALVTHMHTGQRGTRHCSQCVWEEGRAVNPRARTSTRGLPRSAVPNLPSPGDCFHGRQRLTSCCAAQVLHGAVSIWGLEGCGSLA